MHEKSYGVVEEKGICMQSEVMWDRALQSSLFSMWTVGFKDIDAVRSAMMNVVYEIQSSKPVTRAELNKAKVELRNEWIAQLQSAQGVADAFTEAVAMGDANDVNTKFDKLDASLTIRFNTRSFSLAYRYRVDHGYHVSLQSQRSTAQHCNRAQT